MKFDVVIGNPPYQEMTGGGGIIKKAIQVYPEFIQRFADFSPQYMVMIIPARWYIDDSSKSINLRHRVFRHIKKLIDFPESRVCFKEVQISGGMCYFLWDVNYDGACSINKIMQFSSETFEKDLRDGAPYIRYETLNDIATKIHKKTDLFVSDSCLDSDPFGFETFKRGNETPDDGDIMLLSSRGVGYVPFELVTKNELNIYRYKVITGYKTPGSDSVTLKNNRKVINTPQVLIPGVVCTQTYFVVGAFDTPDEAENFKGYLETKFARALIYASVVGTTLTRKSYRHLPFLDFTRTWSDDELYKEFELSGEEIWFIEELIKPMV